MTKSEIVVALWVRNKRTSCFEEMAAIQETGFAVCIYINFGVCLQRSLTGCEPSVMAALWRLGLVLTVRLKDEGTAKLSEEICYIY